MDPQRQAELSEERQALVHALNGLEDTMQQIVYLYFYEKRSFDQISGELNCTSRVVRRLYGKAIKEVRSRLTKGTDAKASSSMDDLTAHLDSGSVETNSVPAPRT